MCAKKQVYSVWMDLTFDEVTVSLINCTDGRVANFCLQPLSVTYVHRQGTRKPQSSPDLRSHGFQKFQKIQWNTFLGIITFILSKIILSSQPLSHSYLILEMYICNSKTHIYTIKQM